MKLIGIIRQYTWILLIVAITIPVASCTSSRQARSSKQTYMLQDKSEYSRNKKRFKGSKAHKKQIKRQKIYKKR